MTVSSDTIEVQSKYGEYKETIIIFPTSDPAHENYAGMTLDEWVRAKKRHSTRPLSLFLMADGKKTSLAPDATLGDCMGKRVYIKGWNCVENIALQYQKQIRDLLEKPITRIDVEKIKAITGVLLDMLVEQES